MISPGSVFDVFIVCRFCFLLLVTTIFGYKKLAILEYK